MSEFIKEMFVERKPDVPLREMIMSSEGLQIDNQYPTLISWTFKALWIMNARGKAEDYDAVHKLALQTLKEAVYGELREKLCTLELAIYEHDKDKALRLLRELNEATR